MKHKKLKMALIAVSLVLVISIVAIIATTRVDKAMGMTSSENMIFCENDTFKFMVEILPNDCVDFTCHGFWARNWPTNPKCAAGINLPARGHQIEFVLIRWSWRG